VQPVVVEVQARIVVIPPEPAVLFAPPPSPMIFVPVGRVHPVFSRIGVVVVVAGRRIVAAVVVVVVYTQGVLPAGQVRLVVMPRASITPALPVIAARAE
jgi:hypothetical protein